jgi:hypothetical protein
MALLDLKNSILDFAKSLAGLGKSGTDDLYPKDLKKNILNTADPKNWNKVIPNTYAFKVVNGEGFSEFNLQINPQDMMQDEVFAINITPTQDGIVSEHNGIILRDLVISGTTGIHPLKGAGGATSAGKTIGTAPKSRSGYYEFNELRNYFRAYAEKKREEKNLSPDKSMQLLFINRKDNEKLIVEPLKFTMRRQAPRSFLYDYNIVLKVIGNYSEKDADPSNGLFGKVSDTIAKAQDYLSTGVGILLAGSDIIGQVEREVNNTLYEPLRNIDLAVRVAGGYSAQVWNLGNDFISKFSPYATKAFYDDLAKQVGPSVLPADTKKASEEGGSAILKVKPAILYKATLDTSLLSTDQQATFLQMQANALDIPRSFYETFQVTLQRIADNASDSFALGSTTYNAYANRTSTFTPSPIKQPTTEEINILYGFMNVKKAINLILSLSGNLIAPDVQGRLSAKRANFSNQIELPIPPSVLEIRIPTGATLESLALQYLGDITRWIEIVELNNLIPPYIDSTGLSSNTRIKKYNQKLSHTQ